MKVKASLHLHTSEDKIEGYFINYNIYQLIDRAALLGFRVLALTCHQSVVYRPDFASYAKSKGILLLFGIELFIKVNFLHHHDVVVLNINPDDKEKIEVIDNYNTLAEYKRSHPEIFILAPHPLYGWRDSIGKRNLIKQIDLFDGIEYCWFYSKKINPNLWATRIAQKFNKPLLATSDLHLFNRFDCFASDYIIVETKALDSENFFTALNAKKFINVSQPKKIFHLIFSLVIHKLREFFLISRKFKRNKDYGKI